MGRGRLLILQAMAGIVVAMLALAGMAWAQGGGGGDNPGVPGGDTTAPRVVKVVPANNTTGFDRDANIKARFSERMRAASIEYNFDVYRGNLTYSQLNPSGFDCINPPAPTPSVDAAVTYNANTKTATLNPSARLAPRTTYTVKVEGAGDYFDENCFVIAVEDRAGNPMAKDRIWHFRTGRR